MRWGYHPLTGRAALAMAFGRRTGKDGGKRKAGHAPVQPADEHVRPEDTVVASAAAASGVEDQEELQGPFDIDDFDDPSVAVLARLDLGSVLIPMPAAGQVQVELTESGVPSAVWVITPNGRYSIAAYAAPKTGGLWREVAGELADSLRKDSAKVSIKDGPWGREVIGIAAGVVRFIGVNGYRWMIRCVVNGPQETVDALTEEAREALADTVVRRGDTPLPVRTPLPVHLPEPMAAQLREAAAAQADTQRQAAAGLHAAALKDRRCSSCAARRAASPTTPTVRARRVAA